jgi:hypothetical protein
MAHFIMGFMILPVLWNAKESTRQYHWHSVTLRKPMIHLPGADYTKLRNIGFGGMVLSLTGSMY